MTAVQSFFAAACTDRTAVQAIDTLWLPRPLAPWVQSAQRRRSVLGEEPLDRLFCGTYSCGMESFSSSSPGRRRSFSHRHFEPWGIFSHAES